MEDRDYSLRNAAKAIGQRKLMVAGVASFLLAASAAMVFSVPPTYRAETSMLMVFHEEYASLTANSRPDSAIHVGLGEAIASEMQILNSRALKVQLVEKLGVDGLFPPAPKKPGLVESLWTALTGRQLDLAQLKEEVRSQLVGMGIDLEAIGQWLSPPMSPEDAAVERLAKHLNIKRVDGSNVIIAQYTYDDPEVAAYTLNALVGLFQKRRQDLFANSDHQPLEVESETALSDLRNIEAQMDGVARSFGGAALADQIHLLTEQRFMLAQELSDPRRVLPGPARQDTEKRLAAVDAQLHALGQADRSLQRLRPEYDAAVKSYDTTRSALGNARLMGILSQDQKPTIRIVDGATPPAKPAGLAQPALLGVATVLSILMSSLLAVVLGPKRAAAKWAPSVPQIERTLGVPVLAIVDWGRHGRD